MQFRSKTAYTTQPDAELISFGVTAISMLHETYVQNHRHLRHYYTAIDNGQLPIEKGVSLNSDDILRQHIITELMCQFSLSKSEIEAQYGLLFDTHFAEENWQLRELETDGLLRLVGDRIEVTPAGRLLIRNIASVFDSYLKQKISPNFSKAI
jgi:oxygen-independent coproporphyrinogen-3 oxidase